MTDVIEVTPLLTDLVAPGLAHGAIASGERLEHVGNALLHPHRLLHRLVAVELGSAQPGRVHDVDDPLRLPWVPGPGDPDDISAAASELRA